MGIGTILATTLKNMPWRTIATAAMERAPEFYKMARERFQKQGEQAGEAAVATELQARITRLEGLLLEQEGVIRQQSEKSSRLEERCAALQARLFSFKIISGLLFVAAMILLALLLKQH